MISRLFGLEATLFNGFDGQASRGEITGPIHEQYGVNISIKHEAIKLNDPAVSLLGLLGGFG
ncbi:MAG: hypothetical protein AMJ79_01995 [Phycisphaerae bacterium SM23_30]|nr:MAG: hypothetical protein AMJ79_01995 [Phycisphaerae bacterium SM23_30]